MPALNLPAPPPPPPPPPPPATSLGPPVTPAPPPEWRPPARSEFWQYNRPSTARRVFVVGGVVLATALWTAVAVFTVSQLADESEPDEAALGEAEWDPEIEPFAREVERIQGSEFREPVDVRFLSDDEFADLLTGGRSSNEIDVSVEDVADVVAGWRALGLTDLSDAEVASNNTIAPEGLRGLYVAELKRVFLRESETGVVRELRLVHELTHALDDQRFDWLSLVDEINSLDQVVMVRALEEGNATVTERRYFDELSESDQDIYREHETELAEELVESLDNPPFLDAGAVIPYTLGYAFAEFLLAADGPDGVGKAYDDLPRSSLGLIDLSFALEPFEPVRVDAVEIDPGDDEIEEGAAPFDPLTFYLVLSGRIDPEVALEAADAWRGSASVAFRRGGATCVKVAIASDAAGIGAIRTGVDAWAATMPAGAVTIEAGRVDGEVLFIACDPGVDATAPDRDAGEMIAVPLVRNSAVTRLVRDGADVRAANCAADVVLLDPDVASSVIDAVNDGALTIDEFTESVDAELNDALAAC